MNIRAILTGATGMVGEGVLHECLLDERVEAVLVVGRKSCGVMHPKLKEVLHADFFDLSPIAPELTGYNTCFFCSGVSSVGMKEVDYNGYTYTLTIAVAQLLSRLNPEMTFCYVSGAGTDSTEKGNRMWARIKGKTENALFKLPFKRAYAFRPGYMHPTKGLRNTLKYYSYFSWMYPLLRILLPNSVSTLGEVGRAMIKVAAQGYEKNILEVKDIHLAAGNN